MFLPGVLRRHGIPASAKRRASVKLHLEPLETRLVPTSYTLPLVNQTSLNPSQYSIYVLGFSVASNLALDASGHFSNDSASTSIPAFNINSMPNIVLDKPIAGARVYFFIAPPGTPPNPFPRDPGTGGVTQPTNPPNSNYPPFDIVEFTMAAGGPNPLHIDLQTVDGFIFPLTLTLNNQLGQVGTPLPTMGPTVTRQDILTAYPAFMASQGPAGDAYLPLVFGPGSIAGQAGGVVNPG